MRESSFVRPMNACALALIITGAAAGADLRAILSEIPSSPTSIVPGAVDGLGQPIVARWTAILGLAVRGDGDEWFVRGLTDLPADIQWATARGTGLTGSIFQQEGQPIPGGPASHVWNAFVDEPPASWNSAGVLAYSARARTGVPNEQVEVVGMVSGRTHVIVHREGDSVSNLPECGAPQLGNSIASVQMLDTGLIAYGNTPITGCSSFYYPALFHGTSAVVRTGVDPIGDGALGEEIIADGSYQTAAFSLDGMHYLWPVSTNNPNTAQDTCLVLDGDVVLREGLPVAGSSLIMDQTFKAAFAANGDWYARGDAGTTSTAPDWAVRNGVLLAKTGDPIVPGSAELWADVISSFYCRGDGQYVIAGTTTNSDANLNSVIVRNGVEVLAREGDPVDVDGDGQYDDNAFVASFGGNSVFLTDANVLYVRCILRNGAGDSLGDAVLRAAVPPANDCPEDTNNDNVVNVTDLLAVVSAWGACTDCPADVNDDGVVNVTDLLAIVSAWGDC